MEGCFFFLIFFFLIILGPGLRERVGLIGLGCAWAGAGGVVVA